MAKRQKNYGQKIQAALLKLLMDIDHHLINNSKN